MKLLIGGSPCTYWSIAQTKNRETKPEGLGWELFKNYLIALEKFKPDFFLYENNKSMNCSIREQITKELGAEPILINSALVSAQTRQRLYWTNIPGVEQPEDRGILLRDILEKPSVGDGGAFKTSGKSLTLREMEYMVRETSKGRNHFDFDYHHDGTKKKSACVTANTHCGVPYNVLAEPVNVKTGSDTSVQAAGPIRVCNIDGGKQGNRIYTTDAKSCAVKAQGGGLGGHGQGLYAIPTDEKTCPVYEVLNGQITVRGKQYPIKLSDGFYIIRKLTVLECKRLQTVPDDYIFPVSNTQAYKMLGNGWTCDVISHILSYCPGITKETLSVLSMYDGMSCGRIALNKLGAHITRYYATEIDKYAIQASQTNFPDIIHMGDAFQVRRNDWKLLE
ncbi:MAG: DNA cytosine methyltransferase [Oscillospiraceae bacterium]|nr:DNA cytosine methyltransferase [Oscillospiraceae bacterium]